MQKFLVIQTAFIGDVVLATALLEKLHGCFPDARIDFLVRKGNEALLAGHPWLHETLVWDKKRHKLKNLWSMARRIRGERYDKVINVQRFAATGLLTAFSGAGETIGFDKNPLSRFFSRRIAHVISAPVVPGHVPAGPTVHEVTRNQALIAAFTDNVPAKPRLYPTAADLRQVAGYKAQPYITVSPASVWFTKQFPAEKWVDLLRAVGRCEGGAGAGSAWRTAAGADAGGWAAGDMTADLRPYAVYLLGAPGDRELCQGIIDKAGVGVNLAGQLSFLQSAALMRDAAMNYVNDSAPMHFASALDAPVTAVYCSTIPGFGFGPLSTRSYIVEIREPLSCRPCGLHGYKVCPQRHFNCAHKIQEWQLLETLRANDEPQ